MMTCHAIALAFVALLATGVAQAQETSGPSESVATPQTACLIDDHLSVWLSLEAADRMVASLEEEFRGLTAQMAKHSATLELMDGGKLASQGVTFTRTGVPRSIEPGDRETLNTIQDQIKTRLTEVSKTLKQRKLQRAVLEEWLNVYQGARASDGS